MHQNKKSTTLEATEIEAAVLTLEKADSSEKRDNKIFL